MFSEEEFYNRLNDYCKIPNIDFENLDTFTVVRNMKSGRIDMISPSTYVDVGWKCDIRYSQLLGFLTFCPSDILTSE